MRHFLVSVLVLSAFYIAQSLSERFSASDAMEKLAVDELQIFEEFKLLSRRLMRETNDLNLKVEHWRLDIMNIARNPHKNIHNPIGAFLLIKRMTENLDLMKRKFLSAFDEFEEKIGPMRPTSDDLSGAVEGLLRTQTIYRLETSEIVRGSIAGEKLHDALKPHDLFVIAREASKLGDKGFLADQYLQLANSSADISRDVSAKEIEELAVVIKNQTRDDPFDETYEKTGTFSMKKEGITFSLGCRQKLLKTPAESKDLRCRYVSNSAFSKIAPFKMIEADHHSNVVVFLDVLSDSEIETLKNISHSRFIRAGTTKGKESVFNSIRVSQVAWFTDFDHPLVAKISRRVEDMTGLTTKTAEQLQIQNYGIGGHYNLHWDIRIKRDEPFAMGTGNRIATLLFYMTTVEKGGGTIFPYLKVFVPAIKGTAAFWYNLRDNGDDDYYTRHAACPVIIGTKWVANKWFHEYGQEFRRPCKSGDYVETKEEDFSRDVY